MTASSNDPWRFLIRGDVGHADFAPWILRHAARLGVEGRVVSQAPDCIEVAAQGPAELVEALAIGCSLGPQSVLVDAVEHLPDARGQRRDLAFLRD